MDFMTTFCGFYEDLLDLQSNSNDKIMKKIQFHSNIWQHIVKTLIFIGAIALIVQLFPTTNHFKYYFEVGKPWRYELVTASFDFPIYKDEEQLAEEQKEALREYTPYFNIDTTICSHIMKEIISNQNRQALRPDMERYLAEQFKKIYTQGVLSADMHDQLLKDDIAHVAIVDNKRHVATTEATALYTPKTAYETINRSAPQHLADQLSSLNLNRLLKPNLTLDTITSAIAKKEIIDGISLTSGMVQSGERIIDRGEIITPETYRILNSLKIAYEERTTTIHQSAQVIIGEVILVTLFIVLQILYLYLFRPRIFNNSMHLLFLVLMILLMVALTSLTLKYTSLSIYIVPFALLPIIVRVFFDSRTALFAHMISTMLISFIVPSPFEFIILQMAIGMAAVSSLKEMTQRSQLAQTSLWIFASYSIMYISFTLISEGDISKIEWLPFVYFALSSLFLLFAYGLIYLFEKIFGLTSSITLVELTNVNSDLMIRFAEAAPGTFQHSLQVSNLATEAAKKINANSLLVRTGALYHDIGKMERPQYFIENQQGGHNPLNDLPLEEAAQVVISHVTDGIKIAHKKGLPDTIINFISTHHGKSKVKYFYNTFVNRYPDRVPDESLFTYPGPLPNTKETALLMMADAVEARSRSLDEYTEESINQMVESMINGQIADGMFKETNLSFRDVEVIKSVFKSKIKNMYHHRIAYPEIKKNTVSEPAEEKQTEKNNQTSETEAGKSE